MLALPICSWTDAPVSGGSGTSLCTQQRTNLLQPIDNAWIKFIHNLCLGNDLTPTQFRIVKILQRPFEALLKGV
jgi:hypothetical protein